ncbi:MAG: aldehyde dehydrogenase family protein, partial [Rikenellaceae bacterium]|nr:aldehyde dehydrogenase family protein [Rikenellaceae bacterium]
MTVNPQKTDLIQSINPATGEVLKEFPQMSDDQIDRIVERVDQAYRQWRAVAFEKRADLLNRVA